MPITVEEVEVDSNSTATDTITLPKPATGQDGDLFVAILGIYDDHWTITPPSGWTNETLQVDVAGTDRTAAIYYKDITDYSAEPASYDFVFDGGTEPCQGVLLCIRGADNDTNFEAGDANTAYDSGQDVACPDITTLTDDALVLIIALLAYNGTFGGTGWTVPSGTPTVTSHWSGGPAGGDSTVALAVGSYTQESAGATGARSWTNDYNSAADEIGMQFAIKAEEDAGGTIGGVTPSGQISRSISISRLKSGAI
jgi:hypothetical protein